ncbi:uncharacterized protein LOC125952906 [Anopheles darlingi]|uniref:Uncharacterized protein n=1 Tax=Anopheles darlingi TaxID=43151 RepID=A0A2M4CUN8_ANODA|nr:uncharacterized protein LOC125952906 [Anopheles darlingi]
MFRRSKQTTAPLPKPPTEEQMMEDLQLYHETRPRIVAKIDVEGESLGAEPKIETWWKEFEATLEDHRELQDIKLNLEQMRTVLQKTKSNLQSSCKDIELQIEHDLERIRTTLNE